MTDHLATTKRTRLSPRQRLKLFEEHAGCCKLCGLKIVPGETWICEHGRPLGLSGTNEWDNLYPVHKRCADAKTWDEDLPRIAKAKRQKQAHLGIKGPRKPIKSAPFPKTEKPERSDRKASIDKSALLPLGSSNIARRFGPK